MRRLMSSSGVGGGLEQLVHDLNAVHQSVQVPPPLLLPLAKAIITCGMTVYWDCWCRMVICKLQCNLTEGMLEEHELNRIE